MYPYLNKMSQKGGQVNNMQLDFKFETGNNEKYKVDSI